MVRPRERSGRQLPPGIRTKERAGGRVVYEVRWYDRDAGNRHSKYLDSADAAVEFWEDLNRAKRRGSAADPRRGRITFADYCRDWWEARAARPAAGGSGLIRASTAARDASYLRNHAIPVFGTWAIADIRRQDVKAWIAQLQGKGLAAATVAKNFHLLKACLEEARLDDVIQVNPAANVRTPAVRHKKARFLDPDEFQRLEVAMDPHWALVVPFLADTALRIGELAELTVGDVVIDVRDGAQVRSIGLARAFECVGEILGATVTVSETAVEVPISISGAEGSRVVQPPKTDAGRRVVPTITATVARRLATHVAARKLGEHDHLFGGRRGAPMSPHNWRKRVWNPAVAKAGLAAPFPTPHAARHGAVSLWIAGGVTEPLRVAAYAGHRDISTVYRLYGHLLASDPSSTRAALEALRTGAVQESERARGGH